MGCYMQLSKKTILLISIIALFLVLSYAMLAVQKVVSYTVSKKTVVSAVTATGVVNSENDVSINPAVTARIVSINAKVGQSVKKGQILAVLDSGDPAGKLEAARGELYTAQYQLKNLQTQPRQQEAEISRARVEQIRAQMNSLVDDYESAQLDYQNNLSEESRLKTLYLQGAVSYRDYEKSLYARLTTGERVNSLKRRLDANKASLREAQANLSLTESGTKKEQIQSARGQVRTAKGNIESAESDYGDYFVRAPEDAVIVEKFLKQGEVTSPTNPIFRMIKLSSVYLNVEIEESQVGKIHIGQPVDIIFDAYPRQIFKGRLYLIKRKVDNVTGNFEVRVSIYNPQRLPVLVGMTADANIITEKIPSAIVIPLEFVNTSNSKSYVFVKNANTAKKVAIDTVDFDNQKVLVLSGLKSGDVLLKPAGRNTIKPGGPVRIVERFSY